jgi:hypothetical protein
MIITGRGSQTWLAFKPAVKCLVVLVVFLLYILFAAATMREAEWRNEALNYDGCELQNHGHRRQRTAVVVVWAVADVHPSWLAVHNRGFLVPLFQTTFTLIGYGDIVPLTDGGRLTIVWLTAFGAVIMLSVMSSASTALSRILTAIYIAVAKHCFRCHWPESLEHLRLTTNQHVRTCLQIISYRWHQTIQANDMHLMAARFRFVLRRDINTFVMSLIFMAFGMTIGKWITPDLFTGFPGALLMKLQEEWDWYVSNFSTHIIKRK